MTTQQEYVPMGKGKLTCIVVGLGILFGILLLSFCKPGEPGYCRNNGTLWGDNEFRDHMIDMKEMGEFDEFPVFREYYFFLRDEPHIRGGGGGWGNQRGEWNDALQFLRMIDECKHKKRYQEAGLFPTTMPPKKLLEDKAFGSFSHPPDQEIIDMMNDYLNQIAYQVDWHLHKYPLSQ